MDRVMRRLGASNAGPAAAGVAMPIRRIVGRGFIAHGHRQAEPRRARHRTHAPLTVRLRTEVFAGGQKRRTLE